MRGSDARRQGQQHREADRQACADGGRHHGEVSVAAHHDGAAETKANAGAGKMNARTSLGMSTWTLALLILAVIAAAISLEQLTARVWPPHDMLVCL
jgi:hypothetical protein